MTLENTLGNWIGVIDKSLLLKTLSQIPLNKPFCPDIDNVFRAFQLCSLEDCRVVMLGYDPYPQKGIATGVLFGNKVETKEKDLSPALKVVKNAAIDYTISHNYPIEFDNSLESWAKQGILMINSALTVELNKIGSHTMIWRPFMSSFLQSLSKYDNNIVFVLFGEIAQTFTPYIKAKYIIKEKHPAYYARTNTVMSSDLFKTINSFVVSSFGEEIIWYKDYDMYGRESQN